MAVEQLVNEGVIRRDGDRCIVLMRAEGIHACSTVDEVVLDRVNALKSREALYPAAYDALVVRHARERTTLEAQIAEALSALKIRHGAERRAFAANRHNVTQE